MQINLKTVIVFSSALAALVNIVSLGYQPHKKDALFASWAYADTVTTSTPAPSSGPAKLNVIPIKTAVADIGQTVPAPTADTTTVAAKLSHAGLSPEFAGLYLEAQRRTGTPWQLLAAVHRVETGQRGNTNVRSSAGALGPMQFLPSTFGSYALDGDGNGTKDITDVDDAVVTAGRYLAANGAASGSYNAALYRYNHSNAYVNQVRSVASRLGL